MPASERPRVVGPWCEPDQNWQATACLCLCHYGNAGECDDKWCKSRRTKPDDDD